MSVTRARARKGGADLQRLCLRAVAGLLAQAESSTEAEGGEEAVQTLIELI